MYRCTRHAGPCWVDALESRQYLASTSALAEAEGNNSASTATPVDMRTVTSAVVVGTANRLADRDYLRVKVSANSRLQIVVNNTSDIGLKLRITDDFMNPIASTSKRASIYLDGGRSYFLKLQSKSNKRAGYRLDLNAYTSEVPQERLDLLSKGVNLPQWFWNIGGDIESKMRTAIDEEDVSLIKRLGFGHVRLPVDMQFFYDSADPFRLKTDYLDELTNAITLLQSHGLGVIVCPFGDHQNMLVHSAETRTNAKAFTWALSTFLTKFDPDLTFMQTTNEPPGGGSDWQGIQAQVVSAIREAAPDMTIITATPLYYGESASTFGTTGALNELTPYRDTNIVYGLHFYEPFVFTHQGANWAIPGMEFISGLSYPANTSQSGEIADQLQSQYADSPYYQVIDLVRYYGIDQWNRPKVQDRLNLASRWAAKNRVPMILDEFGVYGLSVDDASRFNYLQDVRTFAEDTGMGWTMWDYNTGFGVLDGDKVRYDVIAALDLNKP